MQHKDDSKALYLFASTAKLQNAAAETAPTRRKTHAAANHPKIEPRLSRSLVVGDSRVYLSGLGAFAWMFSCSNRQGEWKGTMTHTGKGD